MRQNVTISLRPDIWARFTEECARRRYTRSREIEELLLDWLAARRQEDGAALRQPAAAQRQER